MSVTFSLMAASVFAGNFITDSQDTTILEKHPPWPLQTWGVFDCTANNCKFAVGVQAIEQICETDCKFPLQTVEAHF